MISAFWLAVCGKLPAVMTVLPITATGEFVPAESVVFHSSLPVEVSNAYRSPLNVVVNRTLFATVAAPYGEDVSLSSHPLLPVAALTATTSPVPAANPPTNSEDSKLWLLYLVARLTAVA